MTTPKNTSLPDGQHPNLAAAFSTQTLIATRSVVLRKSLLFWALLALIVPASTLAQNPAEETPAQETPAQETPAQETPAEETPGEKAEEQPAPKPAQAAPLNPDHRTLQFFLTANIDGNFAMPDCRNEEFILEEDLYYAQQAAIYQTLHSLSGSGGISAPIALNAGDSIFPGPISRYLLSKGDIGMRNLVLEMVQIPYEAHALGNREFSVPREELLRFLQTAQAARLTTQAANLRCEEFSGAETICEIVGTFTGGRPFTVTERDGLHIAITSVIDPAVFKVIGREQAEGLEVLSPLDMLGPLVHSMRQEANLVVVQLHVQEAEAVKKAHLLASEVPGIDVLIVNHLFEGDDPFGDSNTQTAAVLRAQKTGTFILSANSGPHSVITAQMFLNRPQDGTTNWQITNIEPRVLDTRDMPPQREAASIIRAVSEAYCEDWGQPITDEAALASPFLLTDLQQYVLNTMRFSTRSEVALVNRRAFRNEDQFPLEGELTLADMHTALPYNNTLFTAEVTGKVLSGLASKIGTDLLATGLTVSDGKVLVNGRTPNADRRYRVALNDYLAEGGDSVFATSDLHDPRIYNPQNTEEPPTLSTIAIDYIAQKRYQSGGTVSDVLSPGGNFPDLYRKFLWTLTGSLNVSYQKVQAFNPETIDDTPAYDQSQLTVNATDQLNLEGRVLLSADSRNHGWDNDLSLQFATARVRDEADAGFQETKDLIRFRSQYRFQGLRADLGGRWFVPNPLAEIQLETEFDRPETRDWHRMDLRGILGVTFLLADPLELKIGVNGRRDINAPGVEEPTYGLNAGYKLRRINLIDILGRPIQFESELEYFLNDIGSNNVHELRNGNRLYFAVFDQFFFTTTFNAFLYRTDAVGKFGTNTELMIGLNYLWDMARQTF